MFDNYVNTSPTVWPDNRISFLNINEYDNITLGATSTHYFRLPVAEDDIVDYLVSYKQGLTVVLEKATGQCTIEEYMGGFYLKVIVTSDQSRLFNFYNKDTFIQLALKLENGTVSYSDLFRLAIVGSVNVNAFNPNADSNIFQTFIITTITNPGGEGSIYKVDGVNRPVLNLERGKVYSFVQTDTSNTNHPIAFKNILGVSWIVGVVSSGTPGQTVARTLFTVPESAPDTLRYYCIVHGDGMGNIINITGGENIEPDDGAY